jgi:hypothetical protein
MKDEFTRRGFLNHLIGISAVSALARQVPFASGLPNVNPQEDGGNSASVVGGHGENLHFNNALSPAPDLNAWLEAHPKVRDTIFWQTPPALTVSLGGGPYSGWTAARKKALVDAYEVAWNQAPTNLVDPPPNAIQMGDDDFYHTGLKETYAWPLYLAHVAQSLAIEIGRRVSWSLDEYTGESLAILLDSRQMFTWNPKYSAYEIQHTQSGSALLAPPDVAFGFLKANKILPSTRGIIGPAFPKPNERRMTIARLFDWCRLNMWHSLHDQGGKTGEDIWQYRGFPPVSRIISGTTSGVDKPAIAFKHWTAGCNCTTGFLRAVLRTVNIPVKHTSVCGHTLPYFPSEGKHLSHGDDLYGKTSRLDPLTKKMSYPSDQLFIDQTKYNAWFGKGVSDEAKCNNVGRQSTELMIEYPTTFVLRMYCDDLKAKLSHADGQVYGFFKYIYSLPELETTGIWQRLDKELEKYPCTSVPHL